MGGGGGGDGGPTGKYNYEAWTQPIEHDRTPNFWTGQKLITF